MLCGFSILTEEVSCYGKMSGMQGRKKGEELLSRVPDGFRLSSAELRNGHF